MKKKQLETLEKLNEERKLDKETKQKIQKQVWKNFLIAVAILLIWISFKFIAINFKKQTAIFIYKGISMGTLLITLFLFELAYKKDSDSIAITSIEIFLLSIATLLAPYILISKPKIYTSIIDVYFVIYYAIKNFYIFSNGKREYLKEKNDIKDIIKKESKDELAMKQLEKQKNEPPRKKRGRPRKIKV